MRVEIFEYLPILHTGHMADTELLLHVGMQISQVTSLPVGKLRAEGGMENVPIFRIFGLKLLSAFSRLNNK